MMIVIAIDKDNDYGRKAGVKSPVIGHDEVLRAVNALGLADPEDSDTNVGFAALKIAKEVGGVPVIICGAGKGGFKDDVEVGRQLDLIKEKFGDSEVILVTDGAEDESVIPLVESRFKIAGVERVTVKQLEGVETLYYIIVKYLKEILSSRETAKLFLGVPGLVLLLIGVSIIVSTWYPNFYYAVKNFIIGLGVMLFGLYIFKIGFGIEYNRIAVRDFIGVFTYIIIALTVVVGTIRTYQLYRTGAGAESLIMYGKEVVFITITVWIIGKIVSEYMNGRKKLYYYLAFLSFVPVVYSVSDVIITYVLFESVVFTDFIFNGAVAVFFTIVSALLYRKQYYQTDESTAS